MCVLGSLAHFVSYCVERGMEGEEGEEVGWLESWEMQAASSVKAESGVREGGVKGCWRQECVRVCAGSWCLREDG